MCMYNLVRALRTSDLLYKPCAQCDRTSSPQLKVRYPIGMTRDLETFLSGRLEESNV